MLGTNHNWYYNQFPHGPKICLFITDTIGTMREISSEMVVSLNFLVPRFAENKGGLRRRTKRITSRDYNRVYRGGFCVFQEELKIWNGKEDLQIGIPGDYFSSCDLVLCWLCTRHCLCPNLGWLHSVSLYTVQPLMMFFTRSLHSGVNRIPSCSLLLHLLPWRQTATPSNATWA